MRLIAGKHSRGPHFGWSFTMGSLLLFSMFSEALSFYRHVFLPRDHTYWWERLIWVGDRAGTFAAYHITPRISGIIVYPTYGWEWIHLTITMIMTVGFLGSVWLLGTLLINMHLVSSANKQPNKP